MSKRAWLTLQAWKVAVFGTLLLILWEVRR